MSFEHYFPCGCCGTPVNFDSVNTKYNMYICYQCNMRLDFFIFNESNCAICNNLDISINMYGYSLELNDIFKLYDFSLKNVDIKDNRIYKSKYEYDMKVCLRCTKDKELLRNTYIINKLTCLEKENRKLNSALAKQETEYEHKVNTLTSKINNLENKYNVIDKELDQKLNKPIDPPVKKKVLTNHERWTIEDRDKEWKKYCERVNRAFQ